VVRLISAMTRRGGEGYVSASEMAGFCERIMDHVDAQVVALRAFNPREGAQATAMAAAMAANRAVAAVTEFQGDLELDRSGAWGQRTARQKQALAELVEGHMRKGLKVVGEAVPLEAVRQGAELMPPDPEAVERAMAMLVFFEQIRPGAAAGGYASSRTRLTEEMGQGLNDCAEALLTVLRDEEGEAGGAAHARAHLETVAGFTELVEGDRAAATIRRRAAAA
jgi:hypothetical protein